MLKLNRRRSSDRLGERVEFRFSDFRAVQVPVVSDRLLLSIISVGTGKTIAKSSKTAARNGICQWPDSILQTIWFSQDEVSKEFEECQYKIIVSMGSTKTAILGEVFLNLTNYLSSADSTAISLPLKRCNSGTVLQLKIQYLGTKSKSSSMKSWNELSRRLDEHSLTNHDMDGKSDGFDSMLIRSAHSFSGNHLGSAHQDEAGNRDASVSASVSHRSSNSVDSTTDRISLSPRDNSNEELYMGRQDSASSYASHVSAGRGDGTCRSNNSSFSSQTSCQNMPQGNTAQPFAGRLAQLSSGAPDSSKDPLDTAKETIEELRDEVKMWERHSRKLKINLESLKKECADKSRQQAELALELSASHAERDSLTQEIEELKSSLEEVTARQTIAQTPKSGDVINLQKEIKDEVQFLKESNANLTTQLKKTQEANIELVSILQELEETIEVQRAEIFMNRAGRLVMVRMVLTATPIYLMIALDLPKWVIRAIDKTRRGFLWKGQEQANGGNCLVSWKKVQQPLEYGGLGIHNLETLGWALRIRWLWAQKTDPARPWNGLPVQVPGNAQAMFSLAMESLVGNGESTYFWIDRWLNGKTMAELAPNLLKMIPKRVLKQRTVAQALQNRRWVADIKGALSVQILCEYLMIWNLVDNLSLLPDVQDQHCWKLTQSGIYSSKSAYAAFFIGTIKFSPWKRIWKSWAPLRCKFFMWLAFNNRVWTADRLAKRGLPHPDVCPFCDQSGETIQHLLISCVFTRQVWFLILQCLNLDAVAPLPADVHFSNWWWKAMRRVPKEIHKGFNSLIILVSWEVWKHRNLCVFEGATPNSNLLLQTVGEECAAWCMAGASKLNELLIRSLPQGA